MWRDHSEGKPRVLARNETLCRLAPSCALSRMLKLVGSASSRIHMQTVPVCPPRPRPWIPRGQRRCERQTEAAALEQDLLSNGKHISNISQNMLRSSGLPSPNASERQCGPDAGSASRPQRCWPLGLDALCAGGRPVGAAVFGSLPASIPRTPAPILTSCNK